MRLEKLPKDELSKLPYVELLPSDARAVELRSYYDHDEDDWFLYLEVQERELGRIAGGEVVSGSYFSAKPADPDRDFSFPIASIIAKHLSFPGTTTFTTRLESDLHQMAAVLGKFHLIVGTKDVSDDAKKALLETELEYATGLCRAYFGLLQ